MANLGENCKITLIGKVISGGGYEIDKTEIRYNGARICELSSLGHAMAMEYFAEEPSNCPIGELLEWVHIYTDGLYYDDDTGRYMTPECKAAWIQEGKEEARHIQEERTYGAW